MSPRMRSFLYLYILVLSCDSTVWSQVQHPSEPSVNLGDTSFLDALGGPSLLVEEIGDASHEGKDVDGEGRSILGSPTVNVISGLTHIAWLTDKRLLGAWYGVEAVAVVAHVNAGSAGKTGGAGDLTVSALILQWKERNIGRFSIVQRVVLDFDLPVGAYDRKVNVNLSGHAFTVHPNYAVTMFPTKRLEQLVSSLPMERDESCASV